MGRYKNRELLNAGVDAFKMYLKDYDWGKTRLCKLGLSYNSLVGQIDNNTLIEFEPNLIKDFGFCYTIKDKLTSVKLAFICLASGETKGFVKRNSFFEVTGQGLELRGGTIFFTDLIHHLGFELDKFTRIDLAFDLVADVDYIHKTILMDKLKGKTVSVIGDRGKTETLYIGKKKKTENTYQLLRIYNKKLDNKKKGKDWLYGEYNTMGENGTITEYKDIPYITRFEIEIRRDKAKFWTIEKLNSKNFIFSVIVNTWFPYNYQFFKFLHEEDFKKVLDNKSLYCDRLKNISERKKQFDEYGNDFFNDKDKKKTEKVWITYGKRLYKNGYSIEKLTKLLKNSIKTEEKTEKVA